MPAHFCFPFQEQKDRGAGGILINFWVQAGKMKTAQSVTESQQTTDF